MVVDSDDRMTDWGSYELNNGQQEPGISSGALTCM